ncbi:branched-chain amino acid transport system ATP-binding protein [Nitrobacteraceae bacterium AZCC 1564]
MLKIEQLHTHYGTSHIIQGIDLTVGKGEVVGIFGRNGVGKTTLLKTIAGWVNPTRGRITLDGVRLDGWSPDKICHLGVGIVPEDRRIFPGLTVGENLNIALLQVKGRHARDEREALDRIYARLPRLAERRKQFATTLSGGEQQMLAMARVMLGKPKLVLIDEPSEGLAPMIVDQVFKMIEDLLKDGASVLLVEQNVHQALTLTDRFCVIERGQIVLGGDGRSEADRKRLFDAIAV